MRKIYKIINIALISMLIVTALPADILYAKDAGCLRAPMAFGKSEKEMRAAEFYAKKNFVSLFKYISPAYNLSMRLKALGYLSSDIFKIDEAMVLDPIKIILEDKDIYASRKLTAIRILGNLIEKYPDRNDLVGILRSESGNDEHLIVRVVTAGVLFDVEPDRKALVRILKTGIKDDDYDIQIEAVKTSSSLIKKHPDDKDLVEILASGLKSRYFDVRLETIKAVSDILERFPVHKGLIKILESRLKIKDFTIRVEDIKTLSDLLQKYPERRDFTGLLRLGLTGNFEVKMETVKGLGILLEKYPNNQDFTDMVKLALENEHPGVKVAMAEILLERDPGRKDLVEIIKSGLKNEYLVVKVMSAGILLKIDPDRKGLIGMLKLGSGDKHSSVQLETVKRLGSLIEKYPERLDFIDMLKPGLTTSYLEVQLEAIKTLGGLLEKYPDSEKLLSLMEFALEDINRDVRLKAMDVKMNVAKKQLDLFKTGDAYYDNFFNNSLPRIKKLFKDKLHITDTEFNKFLIFNLHGLLHLYSLAGEDSVATLDFLLTRTDARTLNRFLYQVVWQMGSKDALEWFLKIVSNTNELNPESAIKVCNKMGLYIWIGRTRLVPLSGKKILLIKYAKDEKKDKELLRLEIENMKKYSHGVAEPVENIDEKLLKLDNAHKPAMAETDELHANSKTSWEYIDYVSMPMLLTDKEKNKELSAKVTLDTFKMLKELHLQHKVHGSLFVLTHNRDRNRPYDNGGKFVFDMGLLRKIYQRPAFSGNVTELRHTMKYPNVRFIEGFPIVDYEHIKDAVRNSEYGQNIFEALLIFGYACKINGLSNEETSEILENGLKEYSQELLNKIAPHLGLLIKGIEYGLKMDVIGSDVPTSNPYLQGIIRALNEMNMKGLLKKESAKIHADKLINRFEIDKTSKKDL